MIIGSNSHHIDKVIDLDIVTDMLLSCDNRPHLSKRFHIWGKRQQDLQKRLRPESIHLNFLSV